MLLTSVLSTNSFKVEVAQNHFAQLASDKIISRTAEALTSRGMRAIIVASGDEAKDVALTLIPHGTQVFTVSSQTVTQIGLAELLNESGDYRSVRKDFKNLEINKRWSEMRTAGSSPELVVGSVQAITQDGVVLDASASGSQLPAYSAGADKVIWIVGAQKIVKGIDEGMQRIYEYCLPLESQRTMKVYGSLSSVNKVLIVNREHKPGRITVILVKENLGF